MDLLTYSYVLDAFVSTNLKMHNISLSYSLYVVLNIKNPKDINRINLSISVYMILTVYTSRLFLDRRYLCY